jgi:hypothetical protein
MATQRKPEWSLQAWQHKFLEKVVLPPCEIRGFDVASAAMASPATRLAQLGRGVKPGSFDHLVVQGDPLVVVGFEWKAGRNTSRDAQDATADAYERCGVAAIRDCRTVRQALDGLRRAGIRLHGNADNIALEYQARVDAALRELAARPKRAKAPRRDGPSNARVRRGAAAYARVVLG